MTTYTDPESAFEATGLELKRDQAWFQLYKLDESLRGFELIIASSNNKAVENVSAELPGINSIANDAAQLRYFKTVSDSLHPIETWGLIAAVLGNLKNRSRFKQSFWWDNDKGVNAYLGAIATSLPMNDDGEVPTILRTETPPLTHAEALKRWQSARETFRKVLQQSREWQQQLEKLRHDVLATPRLAKEEETATRQYSDAVSRVKQLLQQHHKITRDIKIASEEQSFHASMKPGFWARLFRTRAARAWTETQSALVELQQKESSFQLARSEHEKTKRRIIEAQQKYDLVIPDSAFFERHPRDLHQATPWFHAAAQRTRDEVFVAAMLLHRAFIDAAAKPLRRNLAALMNVFTNQLLPSAEKQALLPHLWASLFLVVPLVSTTFASVNRMLGRLPPESLGWLLVDEAGQAVPQAAVGAIIRTKQAVIVGDPIQIEPVVVLPDTLTEAICRQFGVDPEHYSASRASVQTLGDEASAYKTEFEMKNGGSRSVGVPLLVHRRCSEPMFTISNEIAYSRLMVSAKREQPSEIRKILGDSRWIHVEGDGEDKWCSQEGNEVVDLLRHLAQARANSELYVITPFRGVADRLRWTIREAKILQNWVDDEWRWLNERVGTVHTAQGREAEAVIIVLGAPNSSQTGARNWAGGSPNLLNVAVTRAKEVVYVVGNRQLWREAGVFAELNKRLL